VSSIASGAIARHDRAISDVLFVAQIACALGFGVAQIIAMQSSVEGISITWFGLWLAFLLVNLVLAVNAMRVHADRFITQTVIVYGVWTVAITANFFTLVLADAVWNEVDSITLLITGGGIVVAIAVGHLHGLGIADPMVRAAFAVLCKGVPQVTLGWNILREGGAGIAVFAIIAGHLIISMRLAQIAFSIRAAGWDRNRLGMVIGEAANELSWIVVTIAWIISS
jgi:hypothetical protein